MELDIKNLDQLKAIGAAEESNQAYDIIPLPSKGLFYQNKKSTIKVAYLTAADENILLSPNLAQSGKMLDVLLERKVLDKDINIKNLLNGDRDAILVFLRTSGYGNIYPIKLKDPKTNQDFDYDVDLNEIKYKEVNTPDENGEYLVKLPISQSSIKFRMLTIGELDEIDLIEEKKKKVHKNYIDETLTRRLERLIMEIDGDRDKGRISQFISKMKIGDSSFLRRAYTRFEPGIDLSLEVEAPSGEFFRTTIPILISFFYPDIE
jgi:hypothetical protein